MLADSMSELLLVPLLVVAGVWLACAIAVGAGVATCRSTTRSALPKPNPKRFSMTACTSRPSASI